jgi:hypothetical protein
LGHFVTEGITTDIGAKGGLKVLLVLEGEREREREGGGRRRKYCWG